MNCKYYYVCVSREVVMNNVSTDKIYEIDLINNRLSKMKR